MTFDQVQHYDDMEAVTDDENDQNDNTEKQHKDDVWNWAITTLVSCVGFVGFLLSIQIQASNFKD